MLRAATFTLLAGLCASGVAGAQGLPDVDGPREPPPADFAETQYVDSQGCVFMRAGIGGETVWVARLTPERAMLCGYPPSIAVADPQPPAEAIASGTALVVSEPAQVAEAPARVSRPARLRHQSSPRTSMAPVTCPQDAPYRGTLTFPDGRMKGICSSNPERGVLVDTVPVTALVPGRMAGPMVVHGGVLEMLALPEATAAVYVQVGTYGWPANAAGARKRVAGLGLPVAGARVEQGGRPLQIVLAGPFGETGQAREALQAARDAGFHDAFIR